MKQTRTVEPSSGSRLPVKLIGIGEGLDDLRPFDPHDFASALVGAAEKPERHQLEKTGRST